MKHRRAIRDADSELNSYERSLAVLALMRRQGLSFEAACNAVGIDRKTALRHIKSELRREGPRSRYVATPHDRLARTVHFITPAGTVPITVRDSRVASRIAEHMNAVRTYIRTGDLSVLESFSGEFFYASGRHYYFEADPEMLSRLGDAGDLAFEALYRLPGGE